MTTAEKVGVGAILAIVVAYITRPKGTVTTSETFELPATSYPPNLQQFATAIARAEGFYVQGSVGQRSNNPGNLKDPTWAGPSTATGISIFDSVDQGWAALQRQLWLIVSGQSNVYNLDMSIRDMGQLWTATTAEQFAWSSNVAASMGVSVDSPLWQVLI